MDVSRYDFECQKALHQGLQYARSFGHKQLEVEHIALALLRDEAIELGGHAESRLQSYLQKELAKMSRTFGQIKVDFGLRLDKALDIAEEQSKKTAITPDLLWKALVSQSDAIKNFLLQDKEFSVPHSKKPEDPQAKKVGQEEKIENNEESNQSFEEKKDEQYQIPEKLAKTLNKFTSDLTAMAERGELDPVIGRDSETRRVLEILGRKKKNNPILIGEPGVGKTAVAECLALRIAEGRVPEPMRGKRLLSLDLGSLVAGAKFRGEFEERVKNLLQAVQACGGEIILFIDEIHMIVGAGSSEGSADAANLMKPALARGEIRCLGATTLDEYRTYIEKDPALERRFQSVTVAEPRREDTLAILRGIKGRYEVHHGVQINDDALVSAVDLSIRFLPGRKLPDKAIDVLDEACSRLRIQIDSVPSVIDELRSQIDTLEIEKKAIQNDKTAKAATHKIDAKLQEVNNEYNGLEKIWRSHQVHLEQMRKKEGRKQELESLFENSKTNGDFEFAAKLQYEELPKITQELETIRTELENAQNQYSWLRQVVGEIEIAEAISTWTQIPMDRLVKDESASLLEMEKRLEKRVFGQHAAIKTVSQAVRRARVGVNDPRRPLGVFLFVGPTGVGKTETVKALAEEIFDDENRMVRVDMSEFMEQHNVARLIGSPPGYVGYGEGGELTEPVRRAPYTVVLLDEIEKAHTKVLDILLQVFEDGRLTDGKGRLVDFKNTLIILTSNLPIEEPDQDDTNYDENLRLDLSQHLRPEFVGRIDEVVLFRKLGQVHLQNLMLKLVQELNNRLLKKQLRLVLGPGLKTKLLAYAATGQFGGRALRRGFQSLVVDQVSDRVLSLPEQMKGAWQLDLDASGEYTWVEDSSLDTYLPAAE